MFCGESSSGCGCFDTEGCDLETPLLHKLDLYCPCRVRHLESWHVTRIQTKHFLGTRWLHSANGTASFNPSILENILSDDIRPQPGLTSTDLLSAPTNAKINFASNTRSNVRIAPINIRWGDTLSCCETLWPRIRYLYDIRDMAWFICWQHNAAFIF